jgi:hypothetical protein
MTRLKKISRNFGILLLLLLGACAAPKQATPLPYRFTVGHIADGRTEEFVGNGELMRAFPFDPNAFGTALRKHMVGHPFGGAEATVDVVLKHYEVTGFDKKYALSMVVRMSGVDEWGRKLATADISCSITARDGDFALDTYATQVLKEKSLQPLTMDGRVRKIWYDMYDSCLEHTVRGYMQAVLTENMNNAPDVNAGRPERAHE